MPFMQLDEQLNNGNNGILQGRPRNDSKGGLLQAEFPRYELAMCQQLHTMLMTGICTCQLLHAKMATIAAAAC